MTNKEAKARIKINKLLEEAGWRFLDDAKGKANIVLEANTKLIQADVDAFGEDFEIVKKGFYRFPAAGRKRLSLRCARSQIRR